MAIAYDPKFYLLRFPLLPGRQVNSVRLAPDTLNAAKYAEWVLEERIVPYVEEMKEDFEDDEVYVLGVWSLTGAFWGKVSSGKTGMNR